MRATTPRHLAHRQGSDFLAFVQSPEFEHLALRITAWTLAGRPEDGLADIRHSARMSLRARLEPAEERLRTARTGYGRAAALRLVKSWGLLPEAEKLASAWINDQASPVLFCR